MSAPGLNPERWRQLWRAVMPAPPPGAWFSRLVAFYTEPHRHYHNHRHIADCLAEFDRLKTLASDPVAVELALWFHDVIYDPHAANNEVRSADLAVEWLQGAKAPAKLMDSVAALILATQHHDGTLHPDAPLMVDVDLSILGQPPEQFGEYERQIRAEYAWVEPGVFAAGRAAILERFLARPRLYQTDLAFQHWEQPARANLKASIKKLRAV
jgi:predicted metal-dependent HD superfamily phosphohydrolase